MKKSKAEAIKKLCLYYGQEVEIEYEELRSGGQSIKFKETRLINSLLIGYFDRVTHVVKSFRFTGLRGMDEMTEEEKAEYKRLQTTWEVGSPSYYNIFKIDNPRSIDYARSQGFDVTGEYKDVTIEIEN